MERPSPRPDGRGRPEPAGASWVAGGAGGSSWGARLERWAADARVDEAARARTHQRWLQRQAAEEASLAGVLVDLCERGTAVRLRLRGGHVVVGAPRAVGADLVVVSAADRGAGLAVAALAAVSSVGGAPGERAVVGDRAGSPSLRLDDVLSDLAAEREVVRVLSVDGEVVAGRLQALGHDVVTLAPGPGAGPGGVIYVPRRAVGAVLVDG